MPGYIKILQNQKQFNTSPYREHVTPLPEALRLFRFPAWIMNISLEGFMCGALLYLCASKFNVIVSVSLAPAFSYGFMCRLFGKPHALHVAKEFYLEANPPKTTLKKKIRLALLRFALNKVDVVIINASAEASYYSEILALPMERFCFVPWPSNINEPVMIYGNEGYFLSVGRSLRDWKTFFEAVKTLPYNFIVIASGYDAKTFPVLRNVTVKTDVCREDYLSILRGAKGMVLSLIPTIRSTGQASFLEAMAYGKPVVVSDVIGVRDYLLHEKNALLCQPENVVSLQESITRLICDINLNKKIAQNGFNDINEKYNSNKYSILMLETIDRCLNTTR